MGNPRDLRVYRDRFKRRMLAQRPLCEDCLEVGITRASTDVDHIAALKDGGALLDPANVRSRCHSCHSAKTVACDGGFGRAPSEQRIKGCDAAGVPFELLKERKR